MRKPEDARRYHNTRDAVWAAIRTLKSFTVADLTGEVAFDRNTIALYLRSLTKAGYLKREQKAASSKQFQTKYVYILLKDSLAPPRVRADGTEVTQGRGRHQMWQTMRRRKRFTLADLLAMSSTDEHPVAHSEADYYLRHLIKAGYVKKTDARANEYAAFQLMINSGPQAPMVQRIRQVYDPNTKKVMWSAEIGNGQ